MMSRAIPASELTGTPLRDAFLAALRDGGLPAPQLEWPFAQPTIRRKWRFDFAWVGPKVALENDGGAWTSGRHTRGKGFIEDQHKRNAAVLLGWRVLHTTPDQLASVETLDMLRSLLVKPLPECPDPDACSCESCVR